MTTADRRQELEYEPFSDDYRGFDPREDSGSRGPLILGLAAAVVLIFAGVVWNTYRQGVRADGALPVITAETGPYKRAPEDRGGALTPDVDRRIYDQMDGSSREDFVVSASVEEGAPDDPAIAALLQGGPPAELRPGFDAEPVDPDNGMPSQVAESVMARADLETFQPGPAPQVDVAALPVPKPAAADTRFSFDPAGDFLVQIAALRSETDAKRAWREVSATHPDIFDGAAQRIQRADLGAKGVFFRVRAGAFAARADATAFCDALKDVGETCIVVQG